MANSVLGTDQATSIVQVPGEASTIDTMRVVPRMFDLAETGQLVIASVSLAKIYAVDHCALLYIGPNITPLRMDASTVPLSNFSSPGVPNTKTYDLAHPSMFLRNQLDTSLLQFATCTHMSSTDVCQECAERMMKDVA